MRRVVAILATAAMIGAVMVAPVQAANLGGDFQCDVVISPWPGSGTNGPCTGTATGVFGTVVCEPQCDFSMSIDNYSAFCFGNEPPLVSNYSGTISISNGVQSTHPSYSATVTGVALSITTSNPTGSGNGVFIAQTPLPTCAAPGTLRAHLQGRLTLS